jgi:hypothetical protein
LSGTRRHSTDDLGKRDNAYAATTSGAIMATTIQIGRASANERFDDDDPRWRDRVGDLVDELRRGTGSVRSQRVVVPAPRVPSTI